MFLFLILLLATSTDCCIRMKPTTPGIPAIPACRNCAPNLITLSQVGNGVKTTDVTTFPLPAPGCAVRTFTCTGPNAKIEYFTGNRVPKGKANDGSMEVKFTAKCNAAGTGWEPALVLGEPITSVACSVGPPCGTCDPKAIALKEDAPYKKMDESTTTYPNADSCAVRTFTCRGKNAKIEYFTGAGINSGNVNDGSMEVMFPVKCNADGTGWESAMVPGGPITSVACSIGA